MHEMGIETAILDQILLGDKTVEGRLGKPKHLKMRVGDTIKLREDIWKDGKIIDSHHDMGEVVITQVLYFESFAEMFDAIDFKMALPTAESVQDVLDTYRRFYSEVDEQEYGVVAFTFQLA